MAATPAPPGPWKPRGLLSGHDIRWIGAAVVVIIWLLSSNCTTKHTNTALRDSKTAEVSHPGTGLRGGSVELGYALVSSGSSASGVSDEMSDLQERRRSRPEKELGVVKSARELNSDCQVEVNEDGEPMTPLVGEVLTSVRPSSGVVSDAQYAYYMVCVSQHEHHHRVDLHLHMEEGEADLYVSASEQRPQVERGSTWISAKPGDDHLSLPTYAQDFLGKKPSALFVGVHGRPGGRYSLSVIISDVSEREMNAVAPLRGK